MMILAQHMFAQQWKVEERPDSRRPSRDRLSVIHPVADAPDFTAPDPRVVALLELFETVATTGDDDTCRIIEAELFACGIPVAGGWDV